jgi:hypothetical protein
MLPKLLLQPQIRAAFQQHLAEMDREWELDLWTEMQKLGHAPTEEQALQLLDDLVPDTTTSHDVSMINLIGEQTKRVFDVLTSQRFPQFATSELGKPVLVEHAAKVVSETLSPMWCKDLFWKRYQLPHDSQDWLFALASVADNHPECIVVSDMSTEGLDHAMIYVNQAFCKVSNMCLLIATSTSSHSWWLMVHVCWVLDHIM